LLRNTKLRSTSFRHLQARYTKYGVGFWGAKDKGRITGKQKLRSMSLDTIASKIYKTWCEILGCN
jgi:hypothetical protein